MARGRWASGRQLWRLNEEGLLRVDVPDAAFVPGAKSANERITSDEAETLLARLMSERWKGLGRWPKAGEQLAVRAGIVVSLDESGASP